jgi:hypothetical protein
VQILGGKKLLMFAFAFSGLWLRYIIPWKQPRDGCIRDRLGIAEELVRLARDAEMNYSYIDSTPKNSLLP